MSTGSSSFYSCELLDPALVLRTSRAITGTAPQGRLVTKRRLPSLASNARPDCDDPPRYCPHKRGTTDTHCASEFN